MFTPFQKAERALVLQAVQRLNIPRAFFTKKRSPALLRRMRKDLLIITDLDLRKAVRKYLAI